jgi:hypothetical protein
MVEKPGCFLVQDATGQPIAGSISATTTGPPARPALTHDEARGIGVAGLPELPGKADHG